MVITINGIQTSEADLDVCSKSVSIHLKLWYKNSLKIPKVENWKMTDKTMANRKRTYAQPMVYKTSHKKHKD